MIKCICVTCRAEFSPKPKGYNARYCTDRCKRRSQRARVLLNKPDQLKAARARSYAATKAHADRYQGHLQNCRESTQTVRDWLNEYKLASGCVDCGYKVHPAALQLDHEGIKSVAIADARSSISRLKAEIAGGECRVRCANCHAVRTWERKVALRLAGIRPLTASQLAPVADLFASFNFTSPLDKGQVGRGCE